MANKIKYGLKNVHYAEATIADDGSATFATPVAWPGAVNLAMDAQDEEIVFNADNVRYYSGFANNGYSGDYESALVPEEFKDDILGEVSNGNLKIEVTDAPVKHFALLFQFEGDVSATRHVLYNCTASRPAIEGATKEDTISPSTEKLSIVATNIYNSVIGKNMVKARCSDPTCEDYQNWFAAVKQPTTPPVTSSTP